MSEAYTQDLLAEKQRLLEELDEVKTTRERWRQAAMRLKAAVEKMNRHKRMYAGKARAAEDLLSQAKTQAELYQLAYRNQSKILDGVQAERDALRTQLETATKLLDADPSVYGVYHRELQSLRLQLAEAEAALEFIPDPDNRPQWGVSDWRLAAKQALTTAAGKGWVSPEEAAKIQGQVAVKDAALKSIADDDNGFGHELNYALARQLARTALTSDAGKGCQGWLSPEETERLRGQVAAMQEALHDCIEALLLSPCLFDLCPGLEKPHEDGLTCIGCDAVRSARAALATDGSAGGKVLRLAVKLADLLEPIPLDADDRGTLWANKINGIQATHEALKDAVAGMRQAGKGKE